MAVPKGVALAGTPKGGSEVATNRGILGPAGYQDCVQSIRALGRIVEYKAQGITWEADPRHAEIIRKVYNVTARAATTPGVKNRADDIEGEVTRPKGNSEKYRASTMRAQHLSVGRPDIQVERQELARQIEEPTT